MRGRLRGRGRAARRRPPAASTRQSPARRTGRGRQPAAAGGPRRRPVADQATAPAPAGAAAAAARGRAEPEDLPDPPVEDVEVTDLLLVVDLKDEVLVIDEHPRYHLAGCAHLRGRTPIPLPVDEARTDGFTPCAVCEPDRNLAEQARARKATHAAR